MKKLHHYHDVYLISDVVLSVDVFENGVEMPTLGSYQVIKCTYPVTFTKLKNRKEKLHSQTSALRFYLHYDKSQTCQLVVTFNCKFKS